MIEIRGVSHAYGDRRVLREIDVTLPERRIGVIGANGSGKSTFARLLNGLIVPDEGEVRVDGLDTRSDAPTIRQRVGFVFTDPDAQIVMPTVAEDVAFGLRRQKLSREETDQVVAKQLASFGLSEHADHPAHLLSGGQKQLLALCSVLVTDPKILVCDEPTTLLDLPNTRRVLDLLSTVSQRVVLVTHDLDAVLAYERVLVFHEGTIVFDGPPADAVDHYVSLVT
ncbi:ABC transporter ATP-binding protein [Actinobacteria bacterium YIM 96077]|uniref:ABC transporter ATP-binding protein n=1 Tax=Phytoactinopolyspora halophila TaxID=1981511 RepID=A0A329QIY5_9ACTN|nr:ABC transporter ATP-binding protein [Phytoactinopolyspora halophila]AYY15513.1 ABC transporter ATP-binding protein [Actinobacteria bacterium YIM 96077]RAW12407.1 ABC transporter ATP-binding protein [Phytoactinopolyspora halophila]